MGPLKKKKKKTKTKQKKEMEDVRQQAPDGRELSFFFFFLVFLLFFSLSDLRKPVRRISSG